MGTLEDTTEGAQRLYTHTNGGMSCRWREAGEGQVRQRNGKTVEGRTTEQVWTARKQEGKWHNKKQDTTEEGQIQNKTGNHGDKTRVMTEPQLDLHTQHNIRQTHTERTLQDTLTWHGAHSELVWCSHEQFSRVNELTLTACVCQSGSVCVCVCVCVVRFVCLRSFLTIIIWRQIFFQCILITFFCLHTFVLFLKKASQLHPHLSCISSSNEKNVAGK